MVAPPQVRTAETGEADALCDLHRRSSHVREEYRAELEAHPDALGVEYEAIVDGRVRVAVTVDGKHLGFSVVVYRGDGVCELEDLFVDPDVLRQGIGRALVEDAAARAWAAAARELTVVADPGNFEFYERVGFALPGEPASTRFGPATRLRRRLGPHAPGSLPRPASPAAAPREWRAVAGRILPRRGEG